MKKTLIVAAVSASFATAASAQSSVTLYGIVDAGFTYVNNEATAQGDANTHNATVRLAGSNVQDSRWGLKGQEDLGRGMKAIFTLESGFDVTNGRSQQDGRIFGRQAFVGVTSNDFGTVTLGRQYDSVVDYLGPLTANGSWGGTYFTHPFDNDNTYNSFRVNNSVKYQSANYGGFSFGGLYGFSNAAGGFASNRAYSAGMQYANGPFKIAAAYLQTQNTNSGNAGGAITDTLDANRLSVGLVPSQSQRTYGVGANYSVGALTFGGLWTQSRFQYDMGDSALRFNNYELNARYNLTPALALGGAYTYTDVKGSVPGSRNSDHTQYHQIGLQADYSLSKRTDIYAEGVAQFTASDGRYANVYGTAPSSSGNQVVVTTGIRHRF
ncbi:outer membrane protein, (porin) [Caballeronia terrestris]|jgi:GBP family porin|uniref:Outer membrane protein, (Porin) n=1 Tax=Caballeronia terrestris TaxID=1226301 RepID=A0A158HIJ8_9BURK|nr:porin [Caballeronia terrestris]SAL43781.1 outer membrane protein, (porin) [Caballeronia terrestris]